MHQGITANTNRTMRKSICYIALVLIACACVCAVGIYSAGRRIVTGDARTDVYLPLLKGKRVALLSNQTGVIVHSDGSTEHVLDRMLAEGINVTAIFSPEHGFRGTADAGELVRNDVDALTGVPILSLYSSHGANRPSDESMEQFDVLVVDIQDVGLRYYTYYITMCRLIEACGTKGKEVVILDRPNPNGHYVDGPILDMSLKSGVGLLPIPVVHGMTLGELAKMAQGEKWLDSAGNACKVDVIPCLGYRHQSRYELPVAPSPNLPNMQAIYLYPSLCPFEGTIVSLGRGTDKPFQQYGHPLMSHKYTYSFTPMPMPGAKHPPCKGQTCFGVDLSTLSYEQISAEQINLSYVIDAYRCVTQQADSLSKAGQGYATERAFFTPFFDKLMGQTYVREMIIAGYTNDAIRARWEDDVQTFIRLRKPYLLYRE